jgi:hypothetical protein
MPLKPIAADHPQNLFTLLGGSHSLKVFETQTQLCPATLCGEEIVRRSAVERMGSLLSDLSVVYLHVLLPGNLTSGLPVVTQGWKDFIRRMSAEKSGSREGNPGKSDNEKRLPKRNLGDRSWQINEFIDSIGSSRHPAFYFLHVLLPHRPWEYLPSGRKYGLLTKTKIWDFLPHGKKRSDSRIMGTGVGPKGHEIWGQEEWIVTQAYQRFLLQVAFVDTFIGRLMDRLKEVDLYDRSLIMVMSDHGFGLRPNEYLRMIGESNSGDIMSIPLFIKIPHQSSGAISDRIVLTTDVLPTVADVLGIDLPWVVDGRSAFDRSLPEPEEVIFLNPADAQGGSGLLTMRVKSFLQARDETLRHQLSLFGSLTGTDDLFRIGPFNSLVGRSISDLEVVEGNMESEIDQALNFMNIDPSSDFSNSQITGRLFLRGNSGDILNLAVSINGTIHAVTETFAVEKGRAEWSTMVSDGAFRKGTNEVAVFVVSRLSDHLRLERTKESGPEAYSLIDSRTKSGLRITAPDGKSVPVIPGALQGYVTVIKSFGLIRFSGWAADVENSETVEAVVVFKNRRFFFEGRTETDRPDVARFLDDPALKRTGFRFDLPLALIEDADSLEVRFFAISRKGVASELIYTEDYKWDDQS